MSEFASLLHGGIETNDITKHFIFRFEKALSRHATLVVYERDTNAASDILFAEFNGLYLGRVHEIGENLQLSEIIVSVSAG